MISNNEFDDWGQPQNDADGPGEENASVDLMQVAMRRKGLIALGIFVGICLGILYYAQATPIYESTAMISIEEKNPPISIDSVNQGFMQRTEAEDHAIKIATPVIIADALDEAPTPGMPKLIERPSFASSTNPVQDVFDNLKIQPVQDGSEILSLSYRGKNPEECMDVLSTLIATYETHLTDDRGNIEKEVVRWIKTAKDETQDRLAELNDEYNAWKSKETEIFYDGDKKIIYPQQELLRLKDKASTEREEILTLAKQIDVLKLTLEEAPDDINFEALLMDIRQLNNSRSTDQLDIEQYRISANDKMQRNQRIVPLMFRDEELSRIYGKDHPRRRAVRNSIRTAIRLRDEVSATDPQSIADAVSAKKQVYNYLASLQHQINFKQEVLKITQADLAKMAEATKKINTRVAEIADLEGEITRQEELFSATVKNLSDLNLLQDFGEQNKFRVDKLQIAGIGQKVAPSLAKSLAAGTMLGFMAGFGLGYLVEMFDKTFRSPQEVSKVLQLPMIGHIPEIVSEAPEGSALDNMLVTAHKPKSPLAENFRAIRTALYFSTGGQQHRVIQSTSPVPGDGKSTLTANLAISIAQSNKSVLLLDADFRRPTQHKLFGLENVVGLATVVGGETAPEESIQETEIPNLSVMACGKRPNNPSELLTSPQFADVLELLREQYDFVLIDTPPVLAVTDPGVVAARVDGVILTLRIRKNGRPSAVRARKILADLDANVLGIVVNGIDHRSGSYGYYSSYRRGYGYGYNYGYKYGYGQDSTEKALGKYYEEPAAAATTEVKRS